MTDPWRDDLTSQTDMDGCISCGSPTNSHLLLLQWDDDNEVFRAVTDPQTADAYGHVCHGCYKREDGDHAPIVAGYTSTVVSVCSDYDIEPSLLVEAPDVAQEKMDADDWGRL